MNQKLLSEYRNSVTSDGQIVYQPVRNVVSLDSGLVHNTLGSRSILEKFYQSTYALDDEHRDTDTLIYSDDLSKSMATAVVEFVLDDLPNRSGIKVLDVGCGKGLILGALIERLENPNLKAIEPSKRAQRWLREDSKLKQVHLTNLDDLMSGQNQFDLIIANEVLEHVPEPKIFLESLTSLLAVDGILYIGVPNFEHNPIDLLTFDHLTRFTPNTIQTIFRDAHLVPIRRFSNSDQVPMGWTLTVKDNVASETMSLQWSLEKELNNTYLKQDWLNMALEQVHNGIVTNQANGNPIIVYGTANLWPGLLAMGLSSPDDAICIVDDNKSRWGSSKWELTIKSPDAVLPELNRKPLVVISANPCYHERISSKLLRLSSGRVSILPSRS